MKGNLILDCSGMLIEDPVALAAKLDSIVGVVEHGLFLGMAEMVLIAGEGGVVERRRLVRGGVKRVSLKSQLAMHLL